MPMEFLHVSGSLRSLSSEYEGTKLLLFFYLSKSMSGAEPATLSEEEKKGNRERYSCEAVL